MSALRLFAVALIAVCGLGLVQSQEDPFARCHTQILVPHHFLNLPRFLGTWYPLKIAYSKANQVAQLNFTCLQTRFEQSQQTNVLNVTESYLIVENGVVTAPGGSESTSTIGELNPAQPIPAIWVNRYQDGNQTHMSQSTVVASDEDSWALVYHCDLDNSGALLERMFLWSRKRSLDSTVEDVLDTVAYGIGFRRENVLKVDQTQC